MLVRVGLGLNLLGAPKKMLGASRNGGGPLDRIVVGVLGNS